jgi:hypothetical protein
MEIKHDGDSILADVLWQTVKSGNRWVVWTRLGESRLIPNELIRDAVNFVDALEAFYKVGRIGLFERITRSPYIHWEQCHPFLPPKALLQPPPPSGKDNGVGTPPK